MRLEMRPRAPRCYKHWALMLISHHERVYGWRTVARSCETHYYGPQGIHVSTVNVVGPGAAVAEPGPAWQSIRSPSTRSRLPRGSQSLAGYGLDANHETVEAARAWLMHLESIRMAPNTGERFAKHEHAAADAARTHNPVCLIDPIRIPSPSGAKRALDLGDELRFGAQTAGNLDPAVGCRAMSATSLGSMASSLSWPSGMSG